jgi:hypothetical protein
MSSAIEKPLFEIALYRLDWESWTADVRRRISARVEASLSGYFEPSEADRAHEAALAEWYERPYSWQYNEVVGWIRLLWDGPGPVVKGYLFSVGVVAAGGLREQRRFQRGFVAFPFVYGYPSWKVLEQWFDSTDTDSEIYEKLRETLCHITSGRDSLSKRHLDLGAFDALGPYIRWRHLIGLDATS